MLEKKHLRIFNMNGITIMDFSELKKWEDVGFDYDEMKRWISAGFSLDVAFNWRELGFYLYDTMNWDSARVYYSRRSEEMERSKI